MVVDPKIGLAIGVQLPGPSVCTILPSMPGEKQTVSPGLMVKNDGVKLVPRLVTSTVHVATVPATVVKLSGKSGVGATVGAAEGASVNGARDVGLAVGETATGAVGAVGATDVGGDVGPATVMSPVIELFSQFGWLMK